MSEYLDMWKKGFNFSERATRKEFWMPFLLNFILVTLISLVLGDLAFPILIIYYILLFIPNLSLTVRRLHDINKSGWWLFISLVPLVGPIILLVFLCLASVNENNDY